MSSEFISRMTRRSSSAMGILIENRASFPLFLLLVRRIRGKSFEESSPPALGVVLLEVLAEFHHLVQDGSNEAIAKEDADNDGQNDAIHRHGIKLARIHPACVP